MKINKVKLIRPFSAALLSAVLTFSSPFSNLLASDIQSGVITGENRVVNPIISVIVPNNLDFTLDPFEVETDGGGQIIPTEYFFINQSHVPVKIDLNIRLRVNRGSVASDRSEIVKDDSLITRKELFFAMLKAESIDFDSLDINDENEDGFIFNSVDEGRTAGMYSLDSDYLNSEDFDIESLSDEELENFIPADSETGEASINFILAAADEIDSESGFAMLNEAHVGAFRFHAELNTYAKWSTGDVKISANYNIVPLRKSLVDENGEWTMAEPELTENSILGESPEPSESMESTESPEPSESMEPTESPEPSESLEPIESPDPSVSLEPTESPEPSESLEPTESPEPSESLEPTASLAPDENLAPDESPEETQEPEPTPEHEQSPEITSEPTPAP